MSQFPINPPGSKLLRKFYKFKHGKRGTYKEARDWYNKLQSGLLVGDRRLREAGAYD